MYPAVEFEKATGFSGIFRMYKMPHEYKMWYVENEVVQFAHQNKLGAYIREGSSQDRTFQLIDKFERAIRGEIPKKKALAYFQPIAKEIKNLNPCLSNVFFPEDSVPHIYHFIEGAVSGFNPDDIQYYLDNLGNRDGLNICRALQELEKDMGFPIGEYILTSSGQSLNQIQSWAISPKTFQLIVQQIQARLEEQNAVYAQKPSPAP